MMHAWPSSTEAVVTIGQLITILMWMYYALSCEFHQDSTKAPIVLYSEIPQPPTDCSEEFSKFAIYLGSRIKC